MTRTTNARLAGFTYLFYIAVALPSMVLLDRATKAQGAAAKLARIAEHSSDMRAVVVLSVLSCFSALVLAVTLYAITRDEDRDLALLALSCRLGEGVLNAIPVVATLGLLWLGTTGAASAGVPDAVAAQALAVFLLKVQSWGTTISATFFAAGSTLFSFLLLRGRMVPLSLAWLGVLASALDVALLPAQLAGFIAVPDFVWIPMLVFEVTLALWLLVKGGAVPASAARLSR